ncbi:MAG: hypothetical protein ABSC55_16995 [Syntrophorhabdales bacterium]
MEKCACEDFRKNLLLLEVHIQSPYLPSFGIKQGYQTILVEFLGINFCIIKLCAFPH